MTVEHPREEISDIVQGLTGHKEPLTGEQPLSEIGVDSVKAVEILIAIEERFGVEFSDAEISMSVFKNVDSLAELVRRALSRR